MGIEGKKKHSNRCQNSCPIYSHVQYRSCFAPTLRYLSALPIQPNRAIIWIPALPPTLTSPARAISIRHQAQQSFFNQRHPTTRSVPLQFPIHLGVGEDTLTSRPSLDVDPIFLRPWQEPSSSCPILSGRSPLNRRPTDPPASGQHTLGCMACSWI